VFKKILVCLDGSQRAEEILPHAEAAAAVPGSKLTLLCILTPPNRAVLSGEGVYTADTFTQITSRQSKSYLRDLTRAVKAKGIQAKAVVIEAVGVGKAIVDYANENGIDLIAIATHGHGGLRRVVVGSTADYVLRHSAVPVMMITPK
jgi:nucleotide-binding universal stress UspA family protein